MTIDSTFGKNYLADQFAAKFKYGAVFTAAGTGGAAGTEPAGGSPAYARKLLTWGAAAGGVVTATPVVIDVPAVTLKGAGVFDALTAGNYGSGMVSADVIFATQDTVTVTFSYTQV